QSIHATYRDVAAHLRACDILQVDRGSKPQPFIFFVVMKREPVGQTLVFDQTEQPGFPVVAEIVVPQRELPSPARQNADLVSVDVGFDNADMAAAVDHDGGVAGLIGISLRIDSLESYAAEVDGDVVAPHDDRRTGDAIRLGNHTHRPRDDHARLQLYWGLRKRQY